MKIFKKTALIFVFLLSFILFFGYKNVTLACETDDDCGGGDRICIDLSNDGVNNKTCESAAPGLQHCGQYGWYSNGKEQCLGPDGSGVHITPRSNNTIRCKWEYVQDNCYSPFGVDSYGQCPGTQPRACRESGECDHDPNATHRAGRCVEVGSTSVPTPKPKPLVCNYVQKMNSKVSSVISASQSVDIKNSASGGTGGNWFSRWTIETVNGTEKGAVTSGPSYNRATWKAPSNPQPGQRWTILSTVSRGGQTSSNRCSIEFSFPGEPITPEPEPIDSFFQAVGGNITTLSNIVNSKLPGGRAMLRGREDSSEFGSDVGVVAALGVNSGAGRISNTNQRLIPYTSSEEFPTYFTLLNVVLKNAGLSSIEDLECLSGEKRTSGNGNFRFWCYSGTNALNAALEDASQDSDTAAIVRVLIPISRSSLQINRDIKFVNENDSNNATKPIILFADTGESGNIEVIKDLKLSKTNKDSGFMVITNGSFNISDEVRQADGVMVFEKQMNDGVAPEKLTGFGSLLGNQAGLVDAFKRTTKSSDGPAEEWFYDAKYLQLFKNVLSRPSFFWEELPPNEE